MSYSAIVGKLTVRVHPNADKLKLAEICLHQVVVDLTAESGELYLFFPTDGQLSEQFAKANNLIGYTDPQTGERKGGYFAENRRVRAQKFRGQISEGFACPIGFLLNIPEIDKGKVLNLKEGDTFTFIGDIPICNKYKTRNTLSYKQNKAKFKVKLASFPEHIETEQLKYQISRIPEDAIIHISAKLHGTSGRYANCQVEVLKQRNFLGRLLQKLHILKPQVNKEYQSLLGSRRVILGKVDDEKVKDGFYESSDFRRSVCKDFSYRLYPGEIIYGEIVGWQDINKTIMPICENDKIKDKSFSKIFGKQTTFSYGTIQGEARFFAYRICYILPNNQKIELSWHDMQNRAFDLGIKTVPHLDTIIWKDLGNDLEERQVKLFNLLKDKWLDKPSVLDPRHVEEGVVLRIESPSEPTYWLKEKSFYFKVLEGIIKDNEEVVDMEEAEG